MFWSAVGGVGEILSISLVRGFHFPFCFPCDLDLFAFHPKDHLLSAAFSSWLNLTFFLLSPLILITAHIRLVPGSTEDAG